MVAWPVDELGQGHRSGHTELGGPGAGQQDARTARLPGLPWLTEFKPAIQYPGARLNQACAIANHHQLNRLKNIKAILASNLDTLVSDDEPQPRLPQQHENIRGPQSFH